MKTIAIISQKGGAGKTTLTLNLAVASQLAGVETAIIDLDPQASITHWGDTREEDAPVVVSAQASRLQHFLNTAKESGAGLVLLDTAPHSESTALAAARAADFILIPCRPALLDLHAIGSTIDLAKLANKPAAVVLNCVPPRGTLANEATEVIAQYGVELIPHVLGQRASFVHSVTAGQGVQEYEPHGKASTEINNLYKYTCRLVQK